MFKNILVPTDGSKYAQKAEDIAIEMAFKYDAKISAVFVSSQNSTEFYEDLENDGDRILHNVTEKAKIFDVEVVEHLISGDPLRDMKIIAAQSKADIVVISPYGSNQHDYQNKDECLFIGSVADRIIKTFKIPILLVK
ncbi:universal stress protein [Methanobrevibacter curvatus]|uniref:TRAP-T-associated universal stress protein TeaD n=1 Tax=Methanobrevibacter curvatus TaxID=49547 RepID=A0A166AR19_9EURY|nr:universal stress protein [Methanobrevibacter curvatus]KZX12364.1 TRAP-T-associated universal stress protein TeaD [Methanobrevibacter curvatus]